MSGPAASGGPSADGSSGGSSDDSLYPIAVLIDELRNEDVQVRTAAILKGKNSAIFGETLQMTRVNDGRPGKL